MHTSLWECSRVQSIRQGPTPAVNENRRFLICYYSTGLTAEPPLLLTCWLFVPAGSRWSSSNETGFNPAHQLARALVGTLSPTFTCFENMLIGQYANIKWLSHIWRIFILSYMLFCIFENKIKENENEPQECACGFNQDQIHLELDNLKESNRFS